MKYIWHMPIMGILLLLVTCAPVIREDLMNSGSRDVPLAEMRETPLFFQGRLFILGGLIVKTKITDRGSLIEAVYVPVDSRGYLITEYDFSRGRYLAFLPRENGFLDPAIYREKRQVTIAGVFTGVTTGKIDETDYKYPAFEIKEIFLWPTPRVYQYPPYYYYDPFFNPYLWPTPGFYRYPPYYGPFYNPYPFWW